MQLTRRHFLTLAGGSTAAAVLFQACGVPEDELLIQAPIQMPEDMVTGLDNRYATLCRQCPTSEGIVVRVMEGRAKKVEGNVDYPINRGKHSARCEAGLQALYHPDRISGPIVRVGQRGEGKWEEISWTDAISRLADALRLLPDPSSAVMVTDPVGAHLGTVVQQFVTAFGARHVPYEPLERTVLRTAMKSVFGQELMPDFDIENSQYVLSFGADFLNTWVSPVRYARGYGRFRQGDRQRGTLVHVDSRFSMTAANADEWVYVRPGHEGTLALSIAQVIVSESWGSDEAAKALTGEGTLDLDRFDPETVSNEVGVAAGRIRQIAEDFAKHPPSLAIGGGSAAAYTNGLFNLKAIYSLNHLVGSVGAEGGIILNPGPPLDGVPASADVASFADLQQLAEDMRQGRVQTLMVRGADPMYGIPRSVGFREASSNVPLIVSFSGRLDDTTAMADLVLPEHDPLEDWGSDLPDPGPGHQMVGFQQPVVTPFFEPRGVHLGTKGFADVLLTVAQVLRLDLDLPGETFRDILQDGARQLFEKHTGTVTAPDFRSFWHGVLQRGVWCDISAKYSGPLPDPPPLPGARGVPEFDGPLGEGTFFLVPFASVSLTDGRGADLPWLQATPDPITTATWQTWVEINLNTAEEMNIKEGDVVKVESPHGSIEALAYPHPAVAPDVAAIPIGQGHTGGGRYSLNRGSNVLSILSPKTDQDTGALAWAATRVKLSKTGKWTRLPKFEGVAQDLSEDEEGRVIKVSPIDS